MGQYEPDFSQVPKLSESSWHQEVFILSQITSFFSPFFLLLAYFLLKSQLHIDHSCRLLQMDLILSPSPSFCFSPPPPATSVSNLKNTMTPLLSILNTYPSNLQAGPITRVCHGTHSLLLLDWSKGDRAMGGGLTGEHGGPGFGLF